jgi:excisionase family DNA binding protein
MSQVVDDHELLTVPETAALLRLKVSTIRAWVCQRRIPYVKLGGRVVRIRREDAMALVAKGLVGAAVDSEGRSERH